MLLAITVGNTHLSGGFFDAKNLVDTIRFRTDRDRTADEYAALLLPLVQNTVRITAKAVDASIVASVVPFADETIANVLENRLGISDTEIVRSKTFDALRIAYVPPHSVGVDRLINGFAARKLYGTDETGRQRAAIVVDFGTAISISVVTSDDVFIGGAILPGIGIALEALKQRAPALPDVPLFDPKKAIGTNTADGLKSGVVYGYAALVDGLVRRIQSELAAPSVVIATGGFARFIAPYCETVNYDTATDSHSDPLLVLNGLRLLKARKLPPRSV